MKLSERFITSMFTAAGVLLVPWGSACFAQVCTPYQTDMLVSPSPAESEWFGVGVGLGSGQLLVGAPRTETGVGSHAGVVHTYLYNGVNAVPAAMIVPSDPGLGDEFGRSISVDGGVALIGARLDDTVGGTNAGSAYVFRFDGVGWTEEAKLLASVSTNGDSFGSSVGIDGEVAVVGVPGDDSGGISNGGSAYIYRFNGVDWVEEAHFYPTQPGLRAAAYGSVVAVDGDVVVVGSFKEDETGYESGAAYVYRFDGAAWTQEQRLVPNDAWVQKRFGWSVAVRGERVVIGAPYDYREFVQSAGAAYIFEHDGTNWVQDSVLVASDAADFDLFGTVSLSDDLIVVGAQQDDTIAGADSGSAYIFRRTGAGWVESGRLYGAALLNTGAGDKFGVSIAISGSVVAIGAFGDDVNGEIDAGSARVFQLGCPALCEADINGDGFLDNGDINTFITLFVSGDSAADMNGDGFLDNGDIITFLGLFLAGC